MLKRLFIIAGYVVACIWLAASCMAAAHSFISSDPVVILQDKRPQTSLQVSFPPELPEDISNLHDPFSHFKPELMKPAPKEETASPLGLKVKAIILSFKKGVVIEDAKGKVYFLSEGESASGFTVKAITKDSVTVEMKGIALGLTLGGQR
ncbi:MAG: hypothetical protein HGA80_03175 [Candidatus Omnitrophica bacterium]|nr:hypothetical protein [Candidatus Omnitrophota bacterium]